MNESELVCSMNPSSKTFVTIFTLLFIIFSQNAFALSTETGRCLADFQTFKAVAVRFKSKFGRYPTADEGFSVFVTKPIDWNGKTEWIQMLNPRALKDPWGTPYVYLGPDSMGHVKIYSKGEDRVSTSDGMDSDDLNTWSSVNQGQHYEKTFSRIPIPIVIGMCLVAIATIIGGVISILKSGKYDDSAV